MPKNFHLEPHVGGGDTEASELRKTLVDEVVALEGVERLYPHETWFGGALRSVGSAVSEAVDTTTGDPDEGDSTGVLDAATQVVGTATQAVSSLLNSAVEAVYEPKPPVADEPTGAPGFDTNKARRVTARLGISADANVPEVLRAVATTIRRHVDDETLVELEVVNA